MGNTELLEGMIFEYCSCKGSRVSWQEKSAALCQWLSTLAGEAREKERRNIEEQTTTAPLLLAAGVLRVRGTKQTSIGATSEILRGTEDL